MNKIFVIRNIQIFIASCMIGTIAAAIVVLDLRYIDYKQLPIVTVDAADNCVSVASFKNGENYACSDVNVILRNYRVEKLNDNIH
jgi:hypothetical protein